VPAGAKHQTGLESLLARSTRQDLEAGMAERFKAQNLAGFQKVCKFAKPVCVALGGSNALLEQAYPAGLNIPLPALSFFKQNSNSLLMHTLKVKIITTALLLGFGYLIVPMTFESITPLFNDPAVLLDLVVLWTAIAFLLIVAGWLYALVKIIPSIYHQLRYGSVEEQIMRKAETKMKSLDVFMEVARKEFMKRRISKQTFEDIERIAGKKMVELKAKKKEIQQEKKPKEEKKEEKKPEETEKEK